MSEQADVTTITTEGNEGTPIEALSEKYQSTRVKDTSDYIETTVTDLKLAGKDQVYLKVCVADVEYALLLPPVHRGSYRKQEKNWRLYQSIINSHDLDVQQSDDRASSVLTRDDFLNKQIRVDFTDSLNDSCFINGINQPIQTKLWSDVIDTEQHSSDTQPPHSDHELLHLSLLAEYFNSPDAITCDVEVNTEETTEDTLVVDLITTNSGIRLQKAFEFNEAGKQAPTVETRQFIEEVGNGRVKGVNAREAVYLHPDNILHYRSSEYVTPDTLGVDSLLGEWHVLTESQEETRDDVRTGDTVIAFGEWVTELSFGVYPMAVLLLGYLGLKWLAASQAGEQVWTYELIGSVLLCITALHFIVTITLYEYIKWKYNYSIVSWLDAG